ncbi:MAG TPA: hypothetical protein VLH77_00825, partial [Gammaproteobacteria bacterium]|nr:hypothetical protein [Gammaproteobacteria bacterium]
MESSADPVLQRKGFLDRFRKKTPQPSESTPLLSRRNRTETYVAEAYVAPHPEAVENKPAKTCDLIVSRINPQSPLKQFTEKDPKTQLELILKHTTSDTLLIRFGDSLFFYDKETQHSKTIVIAEKDLSLFDLEFKLSASLPEHSAQLLTQSFTQPRRLSTKEQFRLNSLFDIGPNQIRLLSQLAIERPNKSEWRERKGVDL